MIDLDSSHLLTQELDSLYSAFTEAYHRREQYPGIRQTYFLFDLTSTRLLT